MSRTRCETSIRGTRTWPANGWRRLLILWGAAPPPFFAAFDEPGAGRSIWINTARREPRHR